MQSLIITVHEHVPILIGSATLASTNFHREDFHELSSVCENFLLKTPACYSVFFTALIIQWVNPAVSY